MYLIELHDLLCLIIFLSSENIFVIRIYFFSNLYYSPMIQIVVIRICVKKRHCHTVKFCIGQCMDKMRFQLILVIMIPAIRCVRVSETTNRITGPVATDQSQALKQSPRTPVPVIRLLEFSWRIISISLRH